MNSNYLTLEDVLTIIEYIQAMEYIESIDEQTKHTLNMLINTIYKKYKNTDTETLKNTKITDKEIILLVQNLQLHYIKNKKEE